jgi:NADPH-dependent 2,4-dienoyl-CoA reductase/sulfur reductase-like enzyme
MLPGSVRISAAFSDAAKAPAGGVRFDGRMRGSRRLVVVGGVAAGLSAAARARRLDPALEVCVFERTGFCAYSACGLPYLVGGVIPRHAALVARTPEDLAREGIQVHLHHEVQAVEVAAGRVQVRDLRSGSDRTEAFDELLLATGGRAVLPFPGRDLSGVFAVRTVEDGLAIRDWIGAERPRRAVIVGGGYIGLEMAEALRSRGLQVSLVELLPHVLPLVDQEIALDIETELRDQGVDLRCATSVEGIEGDGRARRVVAAGEGIDADLVIVGVGVSPDNSLAAATGVPLGARSAVAVDHGMRTGVAHVWAAGDCAETRHRLQERPSYIPLGTTANKQGRVAGANIAGGSESFAGVVGTAAVKVFDLHVARTGLSATEAARAGIDAVAATVVHRSRAAYYPGGQPVKVKLTAERGSGRLLGAQLAGAEGVAKRIDVVAAALHSGVMVDELAGFDLSYAPPFAPVWDPLLMAARRTQPLV